MLKWPIPTPRTLCRRRLLAIHLKQQSWHEDAPLGPWLRAIARHKLIDALRRRGRRIDVPIDDFSEVLAGGESEPTMRAFDAAERDMTQPDFKVGFTALNRFGFGARGDCDLAAAASDPRGFLKAELAQPGIALLEGPGMPRTALALQAMFAGQEQKKAERERMAAEAGRNLR